jgi:hypothetical protein
MFLDHGSNPRYCESQMTKFSRIPQSTPPQSGKHEEGIFQIISFPNPRIHLCFIEELDRL